MAQLVCKDLCLADGGRIVVENFNLEVNKGDFIFLKGENEVAKKAFTRALLQFEKPAGGSIVFGEGLSAKQIGVLPPTALAQFEFPSSVYKVVLSGTFNSGKSRLFYTKEDRELVRKNIELLEITDIEKRRYKELSGGQQQRVLLARAFCANGNFLYLDEPAAGLDAFACKTLFDLVARFNRERATTVIMSARDMTPVLPWITRIVDI